jgi:hypothetical protein
MIKEQSAEWVQFVIPFDRRGEEEQWTQWLLFYGASYVLIGNETLSIQDPDIALMFRLTFGI